MVFKRLSNLKNKNDNKKNELGLAHRIEMLLARYKKCRHLQPNQHYFVHGFRQLQHWQTLRLTRSHDDLLSDQRYGRAAHFLLDEVYGGSRLSLIANEIQRTANKAGKLLPSGVLETAVLALELNALTAEIDEQLVEALMSFQWRPGQPIYSEAYCQALRQKDLVDQRKKQLDLCKSLAEAVDRYLHSKSVRVGLKVSAGIAESAGVGNLHQFLLAAFDHLKEIGKVSAIIDHIGQIEINILEDITLQKNPFYFMDRAKLKMPVLEY